MRFAAEQNTAQSAEASPHERLWQAVLARAFDDTPGKDGKDPERNRDRAAAKAWLLGNSRDFREVCHLALLDPDAVRERAELLAAKGWPKMKLKNPKCH